MLDHRLTQHRERPLPGRALAPPEKLDARPFRHTPRLASEDLRLLLLELGVREGTGVAQLGQSLELGEVVAAA
jgi:hypothetical protein